MDVKKLLDECQLRRLRRSGPGGQHRNKVETAIVIRHCSTGIEASATERRSQQQNRQMAIQRLRERLAIQVRRGVDSSRVPSPLWQSRCRHGRLSIRRDHSDFPALLAEAMDVLAGENSDVAATAKRLGCTRSQLTKLLKLSPEAFQKVNCQRESIGLAPLK